MILQRASIKYDNPNILQFIDIKDYRSIVLNRNEKRIFRLVKRRYAMAKEYCIIRKSSNFIFRIKRIRKNVIT